MDAVDPRPDPVAGDLEDRLLPWSQVMIIVGLSRTTVWRMQKSGDFPASVQISPNRIGWWQSELLAWKRARTPRRLPAPDVRVVPVTTPGPVRAKPAALRVPDSRPADAISDGRDLSPHRSAGRRRKMAVAPGQAAFDF